MKYLKYILFLLILIPFNAYAYVGALDEGTFWIDNQTSSPFSFTINSNSYADHNLNLAWDFNHTTSSNPDLPGSYLFFSVVSDKQIDINRKATFGTGCNNSCFSNDKYLELVESDGSSYSYVFYFNIVKWARSVGTQIDIFTIIDTFRFTNKENGTAHVYIYGAYSDSTNQIPDKISNANALQQIIIDGQTNTDYIIDNQNDNTNQLIQSNDENTLKIIESQSICNKIDKYYKGTDGVLLTLNGNTTSTGASNYMTTDFIRISSNYNIIIKQVATNDYVRFCFYNSSKSYISCGTTYGSSIGDSLIIPDGADFIRFSVYKGNNRPNFNICVPGNQGLNDNINDLNDNITDNSIDSPIGDFGDMEDMIAQNGVITQLISLPITLYTHILNSVNGTCSTYNLGQLYGTDITFSCISLQSLLGSTLWGVIDILFSGFAIYKISKKMIKVFNNFSGLQEGDVIDD